LEKGRKREKDRHLRIKAPLVVPPSTVRKRSTGFLIAAPATFKAMGVVARKGWREGGREIGRNNDKNEGIFSLKWNSATRGEGDRVFPSILRVEREKDRSLRGGTESPKEKRKGKGEEQGRRREGKGSTGSRPSML